MGDDLDPDLIGRDRDNREAAAVNGDRALLDEVGAEIGRYLDAQVWRGLDDHADTVDVALDEVASETVAQRERTLEVDRLALGQVAEVRA